MIRRNYALGKFDGAMRIGTQACRVLYQHAEVIFSRKLNWLRDLMPTCEVHSGIDEAIEEKETLWLP